MDPNYVHAHKNKGVALHELKRYKEALTAYEESLRLDPNFAIGHYCKCLALERLGRKEEARQAYARAKQLGYGN